MNLLQSLFKLVFQSSLGRKYIMGTTGILLVAFVFVHMAGNLQIFLGPEVLNHYGALLRTSEELLWLARLVLLAAVSLHFWAAVTLTLENRRARPVAYESKATAGASFASRTMAISGVIVASFVVFHILHFTTWTFHPEYAEMKTVLEGSIKEVHDIYSMVYAGFSNPYISAFYIVSVLLLAIHLSHGVSSMFQSLGFRNRRTAWLLDNGAKAFAVLIFVGMSSVPVSVLATEYTPLQLLQKPAVHLSQIAHK